MQMENETSARKLLNDELHRRMAVNPRYSQRAFAQQLGLSPGELSEILRGKRHLSARSALRISKALGLSPAETRELIALAQVDKARSLPEAERIHDPASDSTGAAQARELTLDLFHVVSDWYCFAILNLADTSDFRFDPAWIAQRLAITVPEARIALERLERVGLIEKINGRLRVAEDYVMSPSGIPSEAIRNYHRQMLRKATEALELQPVGERDITGIGLAIHPRHFDAIRKEISEFQDRLVEKYSTKAPGRKSEVYQLEVALFCLTQAEKRK